LVIRAGTGTRPYGVDDDDAVDVVRHHLHGVHTDSGVMRRNLRPDLIDHATSIIQDHLPIDNPSEQTMPTVRADGHEIQAGR
jgi:hypothetical protein